MKTKTVLLITAIVVRLGSGLTSCSKEEGCTDVTAENFNVEAGKDDGSCLYKVDFTTPPAAGGDAITVSENTGTTKWQKENFYLLNGFVFINSRDALTIEEGTVVKRKSGTESNASALIVAKGAQVNVFGIAANPIILTFEADPLDGSVGLTTTGQWGGLMLLGDAQLNTLPSIQNIEEIPTSEPRGAYGGSNNNSGALC